MNRASQPHTTGQNPRSGQEVAKQNLVLGHFSAARSTAERRSPKTHKDYWKPRLERHTYTRNGQLVEVNEFSVRIQHLGKRRSFALGTTNAETAATKARDIYLTVIGKGWEAAEREFAPGMLVEKDAPTIGEFLSEIRSKAGLRERTFKSYAGALRRIVADVFKIDGANRKFDYRSGGNAEWICRIDAVKLHALTPGKVQAWKVAFLADAGVDPVKAVEAKRNVNSFIRSARSLFSRKATKFVQNLKLPDPLPFAGVEMEKAGSMRYKSEIDLRSLFKAARRELSEKRPEQYKIFLLAIGAGLRRAEIDCLMKSQIDWKNSTIWIGRTKYFAPKTEDSEGTVDVDSALLIELRRHLRDDSGEFVIKSAHEARPSVVWQYYRCDTEFDELTEWLRSKGITDNKPLHALRKEFGSQICSEAGIYAAKESLRHGHISTTAAHYLDRKKRTTLRVGHFLRSKQSTEQEKSAP